MLSEYSEKIGASRTAMLIGKFLHSVYFIALIVGLMVCSNLFGWELPVFYLYLLLGILIVLFDNDLKGLIPIVLCCYMTISYENNPAMNVGTSRFYDPAFLTQIVVIASAAVVLIVARLITVIRRSEKKPLPKLVFGFGALGLAMVLGGLFSPYYSLKTVCFGLVVLASLCALYFIFYYGVNYRSLDKRYWAIVFTAIGCGLLFELLGMYIKSGMLFSGGEVIDRGVLQTGWGMYNNVGCLIAMSLAAAVYLAYTEKLGWVFTILSVVLFAGLVMTQSRSSILFGAAVYLAALVILLVKCKKSERLKHGLVLCVSLLVALILVLSLWEKLYTLFYSLLARTFDGEVVNGRTEIYKQAIEHFKLNPFFGVGFYQCTAFRWGELPKDAFLPPRYHNTVLQMLASCGIFGLICYALHRFETVVLFLRRPSMTKTFIALSILPFLLTSLFECHFFSFGPALFYAVLLALAEGSEARIAKPPKKTEAQKVITGE